MKKQRERERLTHRDEQNVFPYLLGAQHAATPATFWTALARQAHRQAHPGR